MSLPTSNNGRSGPLPEKQAAVFSFIQDELGAGRPFPTDQEIARHMGWKTSGSAHDCLMRLVWRGKLRQVTNKKFETIGGFVRQTSSVILEIAE